MSEHTCDWKMVSATEYFHGMNTNRCGEGAEVRLIRPKRPKDLFLCAAHYEEWQELYGIPQVEKL